MQTRTALPARHHAAAWLVVALLLAGALAIAAPAVLLSATGRGWPGGIARIFVILAGWALVGGVVVCAARLKLRDRGPGLVAVVVFAAWSASWLTEAARSVPPWAEPRDGLVQLSYLTAGAASAGGATLALALRLATRRNR